MDHAMLSLSELHTARPFFNTNLVSRTIDLATDMMPEVTYTPKVGMQADTVVGRTTDIPRGLGGQINTDGQFQSSVVNSIFSGRGTILNILG